MHILPGSVSIAELRSVPLLSVLTELQLRHIHRSLCVNSLLEGERLFDQGQTAHRFFMVQSGQIKQFRVSIDGNERVVDILRPGQVFAESLLFLDKPRYPFSADALTNANLLAFDLETFVEVLAGSIDTCFKLMSNMGVKIQHYIEQVDYLTMQNAGFRLVNFLLKQVPPGCQNKGSCTIQLEAPKNVIASWLSIQPETLSRQLGSLKAQDLIQVNGKAITINDIDQLRQMVA